MRHPFVKKRESVCGSVGLNRLAVVLVLCATASFVYAAPKAPVEMKVVRRPGGELKLVQQGAAQAIILAGPDARAAADRLYTLIREELGTSLRIVAPGTPPATGQAEIILCTASDWANVRNRLPDRAGKAALKPEGFLLAADTKKNGRVLAIGADAAGLRYAVGELWNYRVRIDGRTATIDSPLWLEDAPAFSKRIFWNWNFQTN